MTNFIRMSSSLVQELLLEGGSIRAAGKPKRRNGRLFKAVEGTHEIFLLIGAIRRAGSGPLPGFSQVFILKGLK